MALGGRPVLAVAAPTSTLSPVVAGCLGEKKPPLSPQHHQPHQRTRQPHTSAYFVKAPHFPTRRTASQLGVVRWGGGEVARWRGGEVNRGAASNTGAPSGKVRLAAVGFEPTPFRTGALNRRLRPLGHATYASTPYSHHPSPTPIPPTLHHPHPPNRLFQHSVTSSHALPRRHCQDATATRENSGLASSTGLVVKKVSSRPRVGLNHQPFG